jgi:hypothetical protein
MYETFMLYPLLYITRAQRDFRPSTEHRTSAGAHMGGETQIITRTMASPSLAFLPCQLKRPYNEMDLAIDGYF